MTKYNILQINTADNLVTHKDIELNSENDSISYKNISYVVRWQQAKSRSGSASTKLMSEISGTTAKPWKQKGTGRARQGSKRSVQFVGGRTCHGPRQRGFGFTMPSKIIRNALTDSLKTRLNEKAIYLIEKCELKKTQEFLKFLKPHNIKNALIVSDNEMIKKCVANIPNIEFIKPNFINPLDILNHKNIVIIGNDVLNNILGEIK